MEVLLFPAAILAFCSLLIALYFLVEWHSRRPIWETVKAFSIVLGIIAALAWFLYPTIQ